MKAGLCGIAEPALQPADELVTISTYMTGLHLRIEAGVWHNSEWIVPVPVEVSAVLVPELLAERGEPLDTEGKSASWRSREETLTHTYEELVDESWVSTWEPVADKTAHCMAVPGQKKAERDPLDSSDDEEGGADEEEPPKQKKSAPAKSAKPAKAKTTYVPDDGVAVQTGSEEEETPVRGDAEATSEDECILAFARNLWRFPSTAVVGKIGKPIVLSDELYATLRKKTKVPYGRVLSHEVLTMLTGVDNNGEQSRGLYVRYAPKSSPEKKIVLIALSKDVCEFHIGKIIERAEKAGVTEETFPCLSWKPHDLKNGGQIRPQESGWEKSNVPKELLDITTGKRSGPDDDDSASTAIVPTSVGAAKSHKAARIESGTQWIDIDSASDGLKILKINIDNDMDEWTEVAAEEEEWVGVEKKEEEWTEVEMVTETGDGQRTT